MPAWRTLLNKFRTSPQAGARDRSETQEKPNERAYDRYRLQPAGAASLLLETGERGVVKDLSYGGIGVEFNVPKGGLRIPTLVKGTLLLLDQSLDGTFRIAHMVPHGKDREHIGFVMTHEKPETLLFLRAFIEPMRCGTTLNRIPAEMLKDQYRGEKWLCLRGDGPCDLRLRLNPAGGEIAEGLMTFKQGPAYHEVSFRNGRLGTHKSIDNHHKTLAEGSRMAATAGLDLEIARAALCYLLAAPAYQAATLPLMLELARQLKIERRFNAA